MLFVIPKSLYTLIYMLSCFENDLSIKKNPEIFRVVFLNGAIDGARTRECRSHNPMR